MDDWEKFNERQLPEKESFYRTFNLVDISDKDCMISKRVYRNFEIENLGEYHDLYLRSDVILLTDVFENFWKQVLKYTNLTL